MAGWPTGCKVDTVAYCSFGVYSKVYGVGEEQNIANLFSSYGLLEDAPTGVLGPDLDPYMSIYRRKRRD